VRKSGRAGSLAGSLRHFDPYVQSSSCTIRRIVIGAVARASNPLIGVGRVVLLTPALATYCVVTNAGDAENFLRILLDEDG